MNHNDNRIGRRGLLRTAAVGVGATALGAGAIGEALATRRAAPITVDVKADCGAVGDGTTNDAAAFQQAAQMLESAGGGTLVIPPGTYIVGDQFHVDDGEAPYYRSRDTFRVTGVDGLTIEGNGATLRLESGLYYGSFDPVTGEPVDMPGTNYDYWASLNAIIRFVDCSDVTVSDLEIDGNCDNLSIGGNSNIDIHAFGLRFQECTDVQVDDMHIHHNALDGLSVRWRGYSPADTYPTPHTFTNVISEYNGRQGFTWGGGRGISAYNCKFNHTGRATVSTAPRAGLDIEPLPGDGGGDGYFENCEFINNRGLAATSGLTSTAGVTFSGCVFWATEYYSLWISGPSFTFEDCEIYGTVVRAYGSTSNPAAATRFLRCDFEDKPWTDGNVSRKGNYLFSPGPGGRNNIMLEDCTFTANEVRSVYVPGTDTVEDFHGCTFTHRNQGLGGGGYQAMIHGSRLFNCHFKEDFPSGFSKNYTINASAEVVAGEGDTIVDGPHVKWHGLTGVIPPGQY